MNKNEYIIINRTSLEKRIVELGKEYNQEPEEHMKDWFLGQIEALKQILSQSTPLISEIEKAFDEGKSAGIISYQPIWSTLDIELYNEIKQEYISNLKLDI